MSDPMTTGTKGHRLLQSFYEALREGDTKEEAQHRTRIKAQAMISTENISEVGTLLTSWTLVDNYIRDTDFFPEAVLVENRFLIPLSIFTDDPNLADVQVGFTPDVVFERKGGFFDVEDAKFVGRAWSAKKLNRFPQAKLYQIFLNAMGYNVTRTIVRFFNTKTGKVNAQNYTLKSGEEDILIRDFINAVREVLAFREQYEFARSEARRTMNYSTCQYCFFEAPCSLEAEGKDASKTLAYEFVKSDYDYNS